MANTKQAQKMIRKTKKRTQYNRWWKSKVKNAIKELESTVAKDANAKLTALQKVVDKAIKNNVIHRNTGARIKSSAMKDLQSK